MKWPFIGLVAVFAAAIVGTLPQTSENRNG